MELTEAHRVIVHATERRKKLVSDHERALRNVDSEIDDAKRAIGLHKEMLDVEKIDIGKTVLVISGDFQKAGVDRKAAIDKAINDLAMNRGQLLRTSYIGTKNYDRWIGQIVECKYGMAPRHGHVVFRIGMTSRAQNANDLTDQEIEAALYLLLHIETVQRIERVAAAE